MNKIIPIQPIFIECANGIWIDFSKVEALSVELDKGMFNLIAIMPNGNSYTIEKGFTTEEKAKEYRIDLLETYRKF